MTTETEFETVSPKGIEASEINPQVAIDVLSAMRGVTVSRAERAALTLAINTIRLQRAAIHRLTGGR